MKVPPQFPKTLPAPIAFVGEAPSDEEVIYGTPLIGPSGRLFNSMLRSAGMDRDQFLITNVFDEQAPGNDVADWMADPARVEVALARLSAEIEAADPTVIVPLGGTALWAFTGATDISAKRGAVSKASRICAGRKLVPTLHPAGVMHTWKFRKCMMRVR